MFSGSGDTVTLRDYLRTLREHWGLVAVITFARCRRWPLQAGGSALPSTRASMRMYVSAQSADTAQCGFKARNSRNSG